MVARGGLVLWAKRHLNNATAGERYGLPCLARLGNTPKR